MGGIKVKLTLRKVKSILEVSKENANVDVKVNLCWGVGKTELTF